ncbi:methyltransferase domain-containing protein [Microbacterium rhizosphaerae]|uniref:Methyltransferase domain-containing protein n=1 Tax=Microbacterium rhizosphaerae TaxID=1678237 RepID=A0ABZ0SI65_9MICO|nr:methyltransferase domain-containing protein [Microbacterium rhizosphaerae]WPR88688.1 methyltransferase domain-containing protein [Microbacterium rhizosphaerae]
MASYTHGHHESVLRSHEWRTAENSAAYLLPHVRPGLSLLDVGSGPGTITLDLAARVAPGHVTGVDTAPAIVEKAATLVLETGVRNVDFVVDDAYALDAADDAFDIVHAHQVLQHLERPVDALREFRRVVKRDGLVAARDVDYEGVIWYPLIPALDEWLEVYLATHRGSSGEPAAGRRLKAWAREAGFAEVVSSATSWLFEDAADRAWWGGMWADRVVASDFARRAIDLGVADHEVLERISAGWREWAASEDGWLLMPHGEIIARG